MIREKGGGEQGRAGAHVWMAKNDLSPCRFFHCRRVVCNTRRDLGGVEAVFYIYRYARSERIKQLAQKNQKW